MHEHLTIEDRVARLERHVLPKRERITYPPVESADACAALDREADTLSGSADDEILLIMASAARVCAGRRNRGALAERFRDLADAVERGDTAYRPLFRFEEG